MEPRIDANEYRAGQGFVSPSDMTCLRCGVCCTKWQPPLDSREAEGIARFLDIPYATFLNDYLQKYPLKDDCYLVRRSNGACIFLNPESSSGGLASCAIHEHKPEACRLWNPGLEKRECQEGLRKRGTMTAILAPD